MPASLRLGFPLSSLVAIGALVAIAAPGASAPAAPVSGVVRLPGVRNAPPTPFPLATLGPASTPTSLPYPAYGEAFPGANAPVPNPQIPRVVTLAQAVAIGYARSPLLAIARGDVGIAKAAVRLQRAGLLPNLSANGSFARRHDQPGSFSSSSLGSGISGISGGTGVGTGAAGGVGNGLGNGTGVGSGLGGGVSTGTGNGASGGAAPGGATGPTVGSGTAGAGGGTTAGGTGTTVAPAGNRFEAVRGGRKPFATTGTPTAGMTTGTGTTGTGLGGTSLLTGSRTGNSLTSGATLSLQQLIFDGGRVGASIKAAQHAETAAADVYRRELQTVAYDVGTAYYNDLLAQRTTAVDVQIVRQDQVQEALVGAQIRAGTTAAVDLATAQLPTAQARVAVVQAQGTEISAQAAFANAMGLDADTAVLPQDDTPDFDPNVVQTIGVPTYASALRRAFALRPDYDAAVQQVAQNQENLRAARRTLVPTLAGVADYGLTSSDGSAGSFRNASSVGVNLSIPIFDQGLASAQIGSAQAQLAVQQATLQSSTLNLQLNVKQALASLVSFRSAIVQAQAQYNEAVHVLQATQAQYRAGVTTLPLLLNAEVQLNAALEARVSSIYNLRLAQQALLYATGEIGTDAAGGLAVPAARRAEAGSPQPRR